MMSRSGPGSALTRKNTFTGAVEGDRGNRAMDVDVVRLLKTQDLGYLRTVRNVARREREGLEERWVLAGGGEVGEEGEEEGEGKVKRIVFCEGEGEREGVVEEKEGEAEEGDKEEEKKAKNLERLRVKLLNARKRVKALAEAEYQLELQQAKMAKTATSGGYTKSGHKIKVRERKR